MKYLRLTPLLLPLLALAACLRLVEVSHGQDSTLVWLWAWQENRVEFVNSVTGRPVLIRFTTPWNFSGFQTATDAGTQEYYTGGLYAWNQRLASESVRRLQYCSEVGISLVLGGRTLGSQGGCLSASLVWPP